MAKSIMQMDWDTCYLCGRNRIGRPCGLKNIMCLVEQIESSRKSMDLKFIFVESVATETERMPIHKNKTVDMAIKAAGQKIFESECGSHDDFMRIFGKNYI